MPFFNPTVYEESPVAAVFVGSTEFVASGTVARHLRATFAGSTEFVATLTGEVAAGVANFEGSTEFAATGRLNDEANVFGAANFEGSTEFAAGASLGVQAGAVNFEGSTAFEATGRLALAPEISFDFIVDVRPAAVRQALTKRVRRFSARLLVNGAPVPVRSATLNAPPDTLGTELAVELARPDVALVPLDATVDFELGVWTGAAFAYEKLFKGGKLSGRSRRLVGRDGLPADTVSLTFVDVIGNRWNLAPQAETLYFDPDKVDRPARSASSTGFAGVRSASGVEIATVEVESYGLTLYEVLRLAYVEGCGFDEVKTNVEDFPVEQVAFTLEGGYDAGVRPLLTPFAPVVFVTGNVLWIVDLDAALPAGLSARALTVERLAEVTSTLPAREPVDGLLAILKSDAGEGEFFTERVETETTESGSFGADDFTTTTTERRIRDFRTFAEPTIVTRSETVSSETTVENTNFEIISREVQTDQFDGLNRKTGHRRTVESLLPDLNAGGELALQKVSEERQSIAYGTHPLDSKKDAILRVETHVDGLILVDSDNEYLDKPYRLPLTEGHRSGYINPDADQTTEFGAIKSIFEFLRVRGQSVETETRVINHITNAPDRSTVTTRPGAVEIERTSQATQRILLTLPGVTQTRRVATFDGSGLPRATGLALALRRLRKLANPPPDFAGALSFPDSALRRGILLDISDRAGASLGRYVATGFTTTFTNEAGALDIKQTIVAREAKA